MLFLGLVLVEYLARNLAEHVYTDCGVDNMDEFQFHVANIAKKFRVDKLRENYTGNQTMRTSYLTFMSECNRLRDAFLDPNWQGGPICEANDDQKEDTGTEEPEKDDADKDTGKHEEEPGEADELGQDFDDGTGEGDGNGDDGEEDLFGGPEEDGMEDLSDLTGEPDDSPEAGDVNSSEDGGEPASVSVERLYSELTSDEDNIYTEVANDLQAAFPSGKAPNDAIIKAIARKIGEFMKNRNYASIQKNDRDNLVFKIYTDMKQGAEKAKNATDEEPDDDGQEPKPEGQTAAQEGVDGIDRDALVEGLKDWALAGALALAPAANSATAESAPQELYNSVPTEVNRDMGIRPVQKASPARKAATPRKAESERCAAPVEKKAEPEKKKCSNCMGPKQMYDELNAHSDYIADQAKEGIHDAAHKGVDLGLKAAGAGWRGLKSFAKGVWNAGKDAVSDAGKGYDDAQKDIERYHKK